MSAAPKPAVKFDSVAIIGGGIVGLAIGWEWLQRAPGSRITILEKEECWGAHQTGHNSGVIHSGIYYKPGTLKARLAREGNSSMVQFCRTYQVPYKICGKIIVASEPEQLPQLEKLHERAVLNGLKVDRLTPQETSEIEPHVRCINAIQVPSTGIVNYKAVCEKLAELIRGKGGELRLGEMVSKTYPERERRILETTKGQVRASIAINCAGLHSDRVAKLSGTNPKVRIVPFRGEYYELREDRRHLVQSLIYPVPNPAFPFLGVHFTRMIDGTVHAGPNAVLSMKREGYRKTDFNFRDFFEVMLFPGFWRLAASHLREGVAEMQRSFSKQRFLQSLQQLIPEVKIEDLVPSSAGVRAQALLPNGALVDDFLIIEAERMIHVCNAPSPAATASLEIAKEVVDRILAPVSSN